jgi:hypothetical protein
MTRPRLAVVPSNGRDCLKDCLMALQPQVDYLVIIYTVPYRDGELRPAQGKGIAVRDLRGPNVSRWWNQGIITAERAVYLIPKLGAGDASALRKLKWDIAIINDDVIIPSGWFDAVSEKMRELGAAAGCSGGRGQHSILHTQPGPVDLTTRMQGFAFMLAGEKGMRANEDLRWYFSDDYLDWEARKQGGMVMIPGFHVEHLHPNGQMSPELQEMSAEDAGKFKSLYGAMPWTA